MTLMLLDTEHRADLFRRGLSNEFQQELRCSHAGETGAVWIYRGILFARPGPAVQTFAREHLQTEKTHLRFFNDLVGTYRPSRLLPLWRMAGFMTGLLPALFGDRAVFATIEAVETFVDLHYQEQIQRLKKAERSEAELATLALFEKCREDEVSHRDDAHHRIEGKAGPVQRAWARLVGAGSNTAVRFARYL